jgi:hypothetical protein
MDARTRNGFIFSCKHLNLIIRFDKPGWLDF